MNKKEIELEITKNRDLINRLLHSDLSPVLLKEILTKLSKKNKILHEALNN